MADAEGRQEVVPRKFFMTFLNVNENSKGYDGNAISSERNEVVKSLIDPFGRGAIGGANCRPRTPRGTLGRRMFGFVRDELTWNKAKPSRPSNGSVCQNQGNDDQTWNRGRYIVGDRASSQSENVMTIDSDFCSQQTTSIDALFGSSETLSFELERATSKRTHLCTLSRDLIDVNCGRRARASSENICCNHNNDIKGDVNCDDDFNEHVENGDDSDDDCDDDCDNASENGDDIGSDGYFHNDKYSDKEHCVSASAWETESVGKESVQGLGKTQFLLHKPNTAISIVDISRLVSREEAMCFHPQQQTETIEQDTEYDASYVDDDNSELCQSQTFCPNGPLNEALKQLLDKSQQNEMLVPLSLLKTRPQSATQLSSASLKLELSLLESLLLQEQDFDDQNVEDFCLYGKLAVLFGSHSEAQTLVIQATHTLPVGLFNFLDGTVKPGKYSEAMTNKSLLRTETTTLALFIERLDYAFEKHVPCLEYGSGTSPDTSDLWTGTPVAWVITSPGLGVGLNRELKRNLAPIMEDQSCARTDVDHCGSHLTQDLSSCNSDIDIMSWRHLLMLVDEYRMTDDGISLAEVYELVVEGCNRVVNFEML